MPTKLSTLTVGEESTAVARYVPAMPIAQMFESPHNPRKHFDAAGLEELELSIREKGVLTPLLTRPVPGWNVTPSAPGRRYEIAAGHRRLRAARAAGLTEVPAVVREMTDAELLEVLVIENDQREDVHPLEEAAGYQALIRTAKYDVARIAAKVGRSVKYVYDRVKLLGLTEEAQQLFLDGKFTAGHAILLARLKPEDQERAIDAEGADRYGADPGLFTGERCLFDAGAEDEEQDRDPHAGLKPASVREFQGWIDRHVKADRDHVDPILFPETAVMVGSAKEQGEKIIPIMNLSQTPDDARGAERIYSERSWKRADGEKGSKQCDRSVLGLVSIGPGRNEAFRVCTAKEKCAVHWAEFIKARKQRQKAAGKALAKGEDPHKAQERTRKKQEVARQAEEARWAKAMPAIWSALAEAVKKAPTRAEGLLAQTVIDGMGVDDWMGRRLGGLKPEILVPRGQTAEDLVRHAAFLALVREAVDDIGMDTPEFAKRARAFGVDVRKILDQAAPKEKSCRFCGCTENKACQTIAGPCTWLSADVCSAASCETNLNEERKKKPAKRGAKK